MSVFFLQWSIRSGVFFLSEEMTTRMSNSTGHLFDGFFDPLVSLFRFSSDGDRISFKCNVRLPKNWSVSTVLWLWNCGWLVDSFHTWRQKSKAQALTTTFAFGIPVLGASASLYSQIPVRAQPWDLNGFDRCFIYRFWCWTVGLNPSEWKADCPKDESQLGVAIRESVFLSNADESDRLQYFHHVWYVQSCSACTKSSMFSIYIFSILRGEHLTSYWTGETTSCILLLLMQHILDRINFYGTTCA